MEPEKVITRVTIFWEGWCAPLEMEATIRACDAKKRQCNSRPHFDPDFKRMIAFAGW
jgi:hypothetical protein